MGGKNAKRKKEGDGAKKPEKGLKQEQDVGRIYLDFKIQLEQVSMFCVIK